MLIHETFPYALASERTWFADDVQRLAVLHLLLEALTAELPTFSWVAVPNLTPQLLWTLDGPTVAAISYVNEPWTDAHAVDWADSYVLRTALQLFGAIWAERPDPTGLLEVFNLFPPRTFHLLTSLLVAVSRGYSAVDEWLSASSLSPAADLPAPPSPALPEGSALLGVTFLPHLAVASAVLVLSAVLGALLPHDGALGGLATLSLAVAALGALGCLGLAIRGTRVFVIRGGRLVPVNWRPRS